jgi:putative flippase GtrA
MQTILSTVIEPQTIKLPIHERPAARQFAKFLVVGLSSTVINIGVSNLLQYGLREPLLPSVTSGFLLSCLNGFYWNRQWTFKNARGHSATTQSLRFLAVNSVGLVLNTAIIVLIIALFESAKGSTAVTGDQLAKMFVLIVTAKGKHSFPPLTFNCASIIATGFVVFWNYFANRLWTFQHKNDV